MAAEDLDPLELELWPCIPKQLGHVRTQSTNPERVAVACRDLRAERDVAQAEKVFYVHSEFKAPDNTTPAAVAEQSGGQRAWRWHGDETKYPFWAVAKLTAEELASRNAKQGSTTPAARFNMAVGTAKDVKVAVTLPPKPMLVGVRVFPMTNTVALKSGEELLFEVWLTIWSS